MDDRVVVDREPEAEPLPRRLGGLSVALVGVAVAVVVFVVTPGTTAPPATTLAPLPSITMPSTIPRGKIVDQTLEWIRPVGLEEVTQVGGVVEFDGRYWLVGTAGEGIAAWTSADGVNWAEQGPVIADGDWWVDRVYRTDDVVALSASGWRDDEWTVGIFHTRDGNSWDLTVPSGSLTGVRDVVDIGDEYLVMGWIGTPPSVSHLPDPYRELARDGVVWIDESGETSKVQLWPNIEVGQISRSELIGAAPISVPQRYTAWRGPLDDLSPTYARPSVNEVTRLADGSFVGRTELDSALRVSADGVAWETATSPIQPIGLIAPWRDGAVVQSPSEGVVYWSPDRGEVDEFLPSDLVELDFNQMVTGDDLGLVLGYWPWGGSLEPAEDRWNPIRVGERELRLRGPFGALRLVESREDVWRQDDANASVDLTEAGMLVFQSNDGAVAEIPVDVWVEAILNPGLAGISQGGLIHTVDGSEWSDTTWNEISRSNAGGPILTATDRFVVAADQAQVGRPPVEIRVGFPLDAR